MTEPPVNAIAAVDHFIRRHGDEQERLAWAIIQGELDRLQALERRTLETWAAIGPPSEYAHGVRDAIAMILGEFCPD